MADMASLGDTFRDRQGLSSMGFLEHLEEFRKRIILSIVSVAAGFFACYWWHEQIFCLMQAPIVFALKRHNLPFQLVYTNPTDPFNMYLKISLFVAGGLFAYKMVYPAALDFLVDYSKQFAPMITINEYTDLFITIVLGLGVIFEMPILVFFLALFGIVSPGWMWRNLRYSILVIFVVAAIITPTTDIMNMCMFAAPMIVLYLGSIGVAYVVHPKQRRKRELNTK